MAAAVVSAVSDQRGEWGSSTSVTAVGTPPCGWRVAAVGGGRLRHVGCRNWGAAAGRWHVRGGALGVRRGVTRGAEVEGGQAARMAEGRRWGGSGPTWLF